MNNGTTHTITISSRIEYRTKDERLVPIMNLVDLVLIEIKGN
jgi:hypothetical protein